jgi:rhamnogalacturonyl hydrolase YesR
MLMGQLSQRFLDVRSLLAALLVFIAGVGVAQQAPLKPTAPGRSDPSFSQPSIAPGVDYTVPTEAEIVAALQRIHSHFVHSTPFRIIDTNTGQPITDFSQPLKSAAVDMGGGEFGDWTYSMGVVLTGMLQASTVTGDPRYKEYTFRYFDFIFDHLDYFRRQAAQFGPQPRGYRRLLDMHELDDCGAIGAALLWAYSEKKDRRYRSAIDLTADFISHKMTRMPDGTLVRARPRPVSLWADDLYMSVPFLTRMGQLTGDQRYFDDAARQVIQFSDRLMNSSTGLFDHAWFADAAYDPTFYWGRADGWMLMAMAELLSAMPENHRSRGRVLEIYRRAVQGVTAEQTGSGMWRQLLDKPDSYEETSATAMFTFAIARGVNRGWLSPIYAPVAQAGWQALAKRIHENGEIEGICVGTTAAYDAVYYYNRPTDLGAMHGYGPTLLAGAEIISMLRSFDIERKLNTFHYRPKAALTLVPKQ